MIGRQVRVGRRGGAHGNRRVYGCDSRNTAAVEDMGLDAQASWARAPYGRQGIAGHKDTGGGAFAGRRQDVAVFFADVEIAAGFGSNVPVLGRRGAIEPQGRANVLSPSG